MREPADEAVVYDKTTQKVHCLNKTVALVWDNADGSRSIDELARLLQEQLALPSAREVVVLALDQLEGIGLIERSPEPPTDEILSRRQLGRKLAVAGVSATLVPVIASLSAPTPAMAKSNPASTYLSELKSVNQTIVTHHTQFSQSPDAQRDYAEAVLTGTQGLGLQTINPTLAGKDFVAAQTDFDTMLSALGLPPLP